MNDKFHFTKLDARTRELMIEEIQTAQAADQLYFSTRFTESGRVQWTEWLLQAAREHDEHWLAYQLEAAAAMKHLETKAKPKGGYTVAHVPDTAAETMAEGQFVRFYIAAICRRAIADGQETITVYRAKHRGEPRPESRALEGTTRSAKQLLEEVRSKDQSLKCDLLRPNSGLSIDTKA
jgi:hypothetical protein